jgi:hypothetical protein
MTQVPQPVGARGSLKWIQRAVNQTPPRDLDGLILPRLAGAVGLTWVSPLRSDDYAEYRDAYFLEQVGVGHLSPALSAFWPGRGPQWDALARSDAQDILLVEAKAHVDELCSSPTDASEESRKKIEAALADTAAYLGAKPRAPWSQLFYQLANRLAHLHFLRKNECKAWLVLVNFVGDDKMKGPASAAEWEVAYQVAWHVLGVGKRHPLSKYIIHIYPDVAAFPG